MDAQDATRDETGHSRRAGQESEQPDDHAASIQRGLRARKTTDPCGPLLGGLDLNPGSGPMLVVNDQGAAQHARPLERARNMCAPPTASATTTAAAMRSQPPMALPATPPTTAGPDVAARREPQRGVRAVGAAVE